VVEVEELNEEFRMEHGGGVNLTVGRNMKWALRACTRSNLEADGGYERSGF
jgi:hypothetical protein